LAGDVENMRLRLPSKSESVPWGTPLSFAKRWRDQATIWG